jgi:hypothetical protein
MYFAKASSFVGSAFYDSRSYTCAHASILGKQTAILHGPVKRASIIIPSLNERDNIPLVVERLEALLEDFDW